MKIRYNVDKKGRWVKLFSEDRGVVLGDKYYDAKPISEFNKFESATYGQILEIPEKLFDEFYSLVGLYSKLRHDNNNLGELERRIKSMENELIKEYICEQVNGFFTVFESSRAKPLEEKKAKEVNRKLYPEIDILRRQRKR